MDMNFYRSIATVLAFIAFIAIFWWTYSSKRKQSFEEAANIPFREVMKGDPEARAASQQRGEKHD